MDALAFLGVLALGAIVLNLRARVSKLEWMLRQQQTPQVAVPVAPAQVASTAPQVSVQTTPTSTSAQVPPPQAVVPPGPTADEKFIAWLKDNWLLKLGALLLLIGFGWLVSYAFLNNWIGPVGRITLGLVAGACILSLGAWRMRAYVTQGSVFVVLGATIVLLTTYAARTTYDFFTPTTALALMFVTSALVSLVSGMYNRKQLAVAGTALALFAPLLTHSPTQDYVALFAYLMFAVWGAVWVVAWKGFREVATTALVGVGLYSLPILTGFDHADTSVLLLFAYGFAATFYVTHTVGLVRLRGNEAVPDLVTAAGNALLLLVWVYVAAPKDFQSLILAAWATAFILGAFAVFRKTGQKPPLYLYAAIGVGYIAAATAIELDGAALTIAYTLEAASVSLALYGITRDASVGLRASWLLLGPVLLSTPHFVSNAWHGTVFNEHFFVLAINALVFYVLGGLYLSGSRKAPAFDTKLGDTILLTVGSVYLYALVWISIHIALPLAADTATWGALLVWALVCSVGSLIVFRAHGLTALLWVYLGVGAAFIATLTFLELRDTTLTLALLFECCLVSLILYGATRTVSLAQRATLVLVVPMILSMQSVMSSAWSSSVFHQDFLVLAACAGACFLLGALYFGDAQRGTSDDKHYNGALFVVGSLYVYVLLWLSLHAALPASPDMAVMIALFVYTVIGIGAYVMGGVRGNPELRLYGGTLLAFVVGRLLVVDVWQMQLTGRIVTFFIIGTLLMSTAFLGNAKKAP